MFWRTAAKAGLGGIEHRQPTWSNVEEAINERIDQQDKTWWTALVDFPPNYLCHCLPQENRLIVGNSLYRDNWDSHLPLCVLLGVHSDEQGQLRLNANWVRSLLQTLIRFATANVRITNTKKDVTEVTDYVIFDRAGRIFAFKTGQATL
jgi:hypothetical protein